MLRIRSRLPFLFGFAVAVAFWPGLLGAALTPRWALVAAVPPLISRFSIRGIDPLVIGGIFAFLSYCAISLAWSPDPLGGADTLLHFVFLIAAGLCAWSLPDARPIILGMAWGVAVSGVLTIPQVFGWSPVAEIAPPAGLFFNRAALAITAAPLLVWAILDRRWLLAAPLALPVALCESRVAIGATVIGLVAAKSKWLWLAIPAAGVVFGLFLIGGKTASAAARLEIWQVAISEIGAEGRGLGAFAAMHPFWDMAHSDLLQVIHEVGIAAIIPAVGAAFILSAQRGTPLWAATVALAAEAVVDFPLHLPATGCLAAVLAGHLCRLRYRDRGIDVVGRTGDGANPQWDTADGGGLRRRG